MPIFIPLHSVYRTIRFGNHVSLNVQGHRRHICRPKFNYAPEHSRAYVIQLVASRVACLSDRELSFNQITRARGMEKATIM